LKNFFDNLGTLKNSNLKGICCDMWQPYIDIVRKRASKAILVFDKFLIVIYLTKAVDEVRRQEIREKG
jgi:transposase